MAEVSFTKSFLASLESKPVKLQADHVFDPRSFQTRQPITLPRLSDAHPPMPKRIKTSEPPGSSKSVTVHLKSARNPVLDMTLGNIPLSTTTVQNLKEEVQTRVKPTSSDEGSQDKVPLEKIKILWKRKPVHGNTVAEVLADESGLLGGGGHAEFGVMILGGATALSAEEVQAATASTAAEAGGTQTRKDGIADSNVKSEPAVAHAAADDALRETLFWDQLEDFLRTKVHDDQEAARLRALFRDTWESSAR